jgi:histidinol dehydrogenase
MCATMLSIRREGPELAEEKKTSKGWASSGKDAPVEGLSHYAPGAVRPKPSGLMWNCVLAGMAQTKQVARVGRRA